MDPDSACMYVHTVHAQPFRMLRRPESDKISLTLLQGPGRQMQIEMRRNKEGPRQALHLY